MYRIKSLVQINSRKIWDHLEYNPNSNITRRFFLFLPTFLAKFLKASLQNLKWSFCICCKAWLFLIHFHFHLIRYFPHIFITAVTCQMHPTFYSCVKCFWLQWTFSHLLELSSIPVILALLGYSAALLVCSLPFH